jgi:hypothetical protein
MQTQTDYNSTHSRNIDRTDASQGRRVKGMPTVLAISTVVVITAFAAMLIASMV